MRRLRIQKASSEALTLLCVETSIFFLENFMVVPDTSDVVIEGDTLLKILLQIPWAFCYFILRLWRLSMNLKSLLNIVLSISLMEMV